MDESTKSFQEYIEILYRRKWILVFSVVLCTAVAVFLSLTLPSYYRSTTLILVEHQTVPTAYVMPTDTTPIQRRLSTIKQQIMSRSRLEQIIQDFDLYRNEDPDWINTIFSKVLRKVGMGQMAEPAKEDIIARMKKDIEVRVIGGKTEGDAFSISYTGKDPLVVMQVTDTLASLFIEENLKIREQYAEGTSEFLESELQMAKEYLEFQEKAMRQFREKYMGALPEQLDANLRTLDRLQLELQSVAESIKNEEDRKTLLEEQLGIGPASSPTVAIDPLEIEIDKLKNDLVALLSVYKESYPDVIITKKRIKELEAQLALREQSRPEKGDEPKKVKPRIMNSRVYNEIAAAKSRIKGLKRRMAEIRRQIKVFEKRVEDTPANEQKLVDIKRDYEISLQNYKALLGKKLNARLAENLEKRQKGERFRIIDPANLPERPYKPDKIKLLAMGTMAGGGMGLGLVFLFEFLNPAFRKPEDFEGVLTLPVLISIPKFAERSRRNPLKSLRLIKGRRRRA